MPLPDLIEIVPLTQPVRAEITVPGSKSITNRALVLAALADGETTLRGALWSEDTQIMVECLQDLGFMVNVAPDADEVSNRTITVYGRGGEVPRGGTEGNPLELFVGNAGTAARFLAAFVCLGSGVYRLHGVPRMHERPQAALFAALRQLGYHVESEADHEKLPVRIWGGSPSPRPLPEREGGRRPGEGDGKRRCKVSVEESSQFASALLLCADAGGWNVEVTGANEDEMPYVTMTRELVKVFPRRGGAFQIEPDASSGSYFLAAGWSAWAPKTTYKREPDGGMTVRFAFEEGFVAVTTTMRPDGTTTTGQTGFSRPLLPRGQLDAPGVCSPSILQLRVCNWPASGWQVDGKFPDYLPVPSGVSRATELGDSIMTAIILAADEDTGREWREPAGTKGTLRDVGGFRRPIRFTDLVRLRVQECERVVALRTELTKCGAKVIEEDDTLTVYPSQLHGAEIETYNDHRMAMCFAVLGLKVPGIKIKNPACVKKTFPNFFQKLATPPPRGLGVAILDGRTGRRLAMEELFAD
ncbi:MAG: 3-phosphoshikimate 1-carboxyvinyltransferase [Verrucomicrobia bacterium]|nr:3-phosphoshikimate 1-carboxyvinyltransferase [Verrucomicrobiota bacterium]